MNIIEKTTALEPSMVLSVYSGKNGACCCGCSGKHYYNSALKEEAGKDRGYEVDDDEVNDKMIKKVINILKGKAPSGQIEADCNFISTVIGERLYIAYLKK